MQALGCPDWPGCYGHVYPQADHNFSKAIHEMIHRYFATTLGAIIVVLLGWAVWNRKVRGQPLKAVALLFVLVCLQGALGALTVTLLLKPLIVTAHLLGGLSTLAILWWLSLTPIRRELLEREAGLRKFALLGLAALALQIALGGWTSSNYAAVACPDFPTCQQSWWPRMDFRDAFVLWRGLDIDYTGGVLANPARIAIHVTHRIGALALRLDLDFRRRDNLRPRPKPRFARDRLPAGGRRATADRHRNEHGAFWHAAGPGHDAQRRRCPACNLYCDFAAPALAGTGRSNLKIGVIPLYDVHRTR